MRSRIFDHCVITGAGSGLGKAIAAHLAQQRLCREVTLIGRDRSRLEASAAICQAAGAVAGVASVDVTDAQRLADILVALDTAAPIDLLVANAGIGGREVLAAPYGEDGALAARIITVNTIGVVNTVAPLLPRLVARRLGAIAIVGSLAGLDGFPDAPAYCASKAAVRAYAHGLRRLLAPTGIRVTLIAPGYVDTPMSASLPFAKPFLWSAERAAARAVRAIMAGKAEVMFPWQLAIPSRIVALLPTPVLDRLIAIEAGRRRRT